MSWEDPACPNTCLPATSLFISASLPSTAEAAESLDLENKANEQLHKEGRSPGLPVLCLETSNDASKFPHDTEPRTLGQKLSKQNIPGSHDLAVFTLIMRAKALSVVTGAHV